MHILISLCGTSPAVITETIWALAMEDIDDPSNADLPHKIIILTTVTGANSIRAKLLTPPEDAPEGTPSVWTQLRTALTDLGYDLSDRLIFGDTSEHLKVFSKPDLETGLATPLDDIRTAEDQAATADYLLETLRGFTEQPRTRITASLAGGRKTMSSLLYGCMSLVGRCDDRLTHILVNEPYEHFSLKPGFFFSGQQIQQLSYTDQKTKETSTIIASDAQVDLMDVPFVPIRYMFEKQQGNAPAGFQDLVTTYTGRAITSEITTPLTLNADTTTISYGAIDIPLSVKEFAIIHFLATRAKQGLPAYRDYKSGCDDLNKHIAHLKSTVSENNHSHPYKNLTTIDHDDIRKIISSIRTKIKSSGHLTAPLANSLPQKGRFSLSYPDELLIM